MPDKLVIVESPAKAKTIEKYLGKGYRVLASVGHVRDLPEKSEGIDVDNNFAPTYEIMEDKEHVVAQLRSNARTADAVYMATDPDREGEAIAWHIVQAINIPKKTPVHRVTFTEITPNAVKQAIANPRTIDMDLVDAQQARRVLDRLVGYRLSRVLWHKVRRGLSAGRVQSVAVRLVVEREREILAFKTQEFWTIEADLLQQKANAMPFRANLIEIKGRKLDKFDIGNQDAADSIVADLNGALWQVSSVKRADRRRNAAPPFTTSTMQQEASRKLGFSAKKTMMLAQQLYEGIDLGGSEGTVGLITYMRTDSVNVAREAQEEARAFIGQKYGADAVPAKPNNYTTKSRGAQEAHEAVRPTSARRQPADVKSKLSHDQFRLYDLIWKRFIASQMAPAVFDSMTVDISAGAELTTPAPYTFRATGQVLKVPGFLAVYNVSLDDGEEDEDGERRLPMLDVNESLNLQKLTPNQHFTEPPPRYSDASLIKELEKRGIGRPSTYSPTIATIVDRKYVEQENQRFKPTMLGMTVNDLLVKDFTSMVEYDFTSDMEKRLDAIAEGEQPWVPVIAEFYDVLNRLITHTPQDRPDTNIGMPCPKCESGMLQVRFGRVGEFIGCNRYPECNFTSDFKRGATGEIELLTRDGQIDTTPVPDVMCDLCGGPMIMRRGRFGNFLACTRYPECKGTRKIGRDGKPVAPPTVTDVTCPHCKQGKLLERKGAFGRPFYGCQRYPDCTYLVNDLAEVDAYDPATYVAKPAKSRGGKAAAGTAASKKRGTASATTTATKAKSTRTASTAAKKTKSTAAKSTTAKATKSTTAKSSTAKATKSTTAKKAPAKKKTTTKSSASAKSKSTTTRAKKTPPTR
ncbi:MAG: type I DNA topoisomerase [Chloroflexota bacterium]